MPEDEFFGMTNEEFRENILIALVMAVVAFGTAFVGMVVRKRVREWIK